MGFFLYWIIRLNNLASGILIEDVIGFNILGEMWSGPGGLVVSNVPNWSSTSCSVIVKSSNSQVVDVSRDGSGWIGE